MPGNDSTCSKGHYRAALLPNPVWRQRPHHVRPCRQRRNRPTLVGALAMLAAPLGMLAPLAMLAAPLAMLAPLGMLCPRAVCFFVNGTGQGS